MTSYSCSAVCFQLARRVGKVVERVLPVPSRRTNSCAARGLFVARRILSTKDNSKQLELCLPCRSLYRSRAAPRKLSLGRSCVLFLLSAQDSLCGLRRFCQESHSHCRFVSVRVCKGLHVHSWTMDARREQVMALLLTHFEHVTHLEHCRL